MSALERIRVAATQTRDRHSQGNVTKFSGHTVWLDSCRDCDRPYPCPDRVTAEAILAATQNLTERDEKTREHAYRAWHHTNAAEQGVDASANCHAAMEHMQEIRALLSAASTNPHPLWRCTCGALEGGDRCRECGETAASSAASTDE